MMQGLGQAIKQWRQGQCNVGVVLGRRCALEGSEQRHGSSSWNWLGSDRYKLVGTRSRSDVASIAGTTGTGVVSGQYQGRMF